jgi:hypothetical protein
MTLSSNPSLSFPDVTGILLASRFVTPHRAMTPQGKGLAEDQVVFDPCTNL